MKAVARPLGKILLGFQVREATDGHMELTSIEMPPRIEVVFCAGRNHGPQVWLVWGIVVCLRIDTSAA